MSSLLFDDLLYRWTVQGGKLYFSGWAGDGYRPFSDAERSHYLSRILSSLLTHDQLYVRTQSLEEFTELVGIPATLYLLQRNILQVIDDGGTMSAFLPNGDDNLLMNFSSSTTLKFDQILKRLEQRYIGHMEHRLLKMLMYQADAAKTEVDGAWLVHLAGEEDMADMQNQRIIEFLDFTQPYTNIIVQPDDMVPLLRLNQANKSLIYQNELKIDTLSTESDIQQLVRHKYGPYLGTQKHDPLLTFKEVLHKKQIPDFTALYQRGLLTMKSIIEMRESFEGRKFREWLASEDYRPENLYKVLLSSPQKTNPLSIKSLLRWTVPTIIGIASTWPGVIASALDNFVIGRLMKDWHPNLFLDDTLGARIIRLQTEQRAFRAEENQLNYFGRKIGRNEPCPCGTGKKYKNCCGL
jgi:hypothetical protein